MMHGELVSWRRDLHCIPEMGLMVPKTHAYLKSRLQGLRAQIESVAGHGLVVFFDLGFENTIGFRADMDALPLTEINEGPYRSTHHGVMHACGHDAHMAMALGLAHWVDTHRAELSVNVLILFQPGEEQCLGAKLILDAGIIERFGVNHIFALHVEPKLKVGQIGTMPGVLMAGSADVELVVRGASAHIARAEEARDALAAGFLFYARTQALAQAFQGTLPILLKYGRFHSGTTHNIIASHCELAGSLRTFCAEDYAQMRQQILDIAMQIAAETGVHMSVGVELRSPPLVNDPALFDWAKRSLPQFEFVDAFEPVYLAEDFAWFLRDAPGCLLYLGTDLGRMLHTPNFDIDERALSIGLEVLITLCRNAGNLSA